MYKYSDPYDEVDVKKIIQTALKVEDESRQIKHKNGYKVGDHNLYVSKPLLPNKKPKNESEQLPKDLQKAQNKLMNKISK